MKSILGSNVTCVTGFCYLSTLHTLIIQVKLYFIGTLGISWLRPTIKSSNKKGLSLKNEITPEEGHRFHIPKQSDRFIKIFYDKFPQQSCETCSVKLAGTKYLVSPKYFLFVLLYIEKYPLRIAKYVAKASNDIYY